MLTLAERVIFLLSSLIALTLAIRAAQRIIKTIRRGQGELDGRIIRRRLFRVFIRIITFQPVFQTRLVVSIFHGFIAWGFLYYLLVNVGDVLWGYVPNFHFLGEGILGDAFRLGADVLSVTIFVGMLALLIRRFILRPDSFTFRERTLLHPTARLGIKRDSFIVGLFVVVHVGWRFLGESFYLASEGMDSWQPFASAVSVLWGSWSSETLTIARHLGWWISLGGILLFLPYFLYSKHLHLFMAPVNFLLQPNRRSMGELRWLDFEDQDIEQFGAERLEHLPWPLILDAYACIMCNRCQDACPAYETGKVLSPAALEINKRYFLNQEGARLASVEESRQALTEFSIPPEAIWACTACGACVEICPVGNEPMQDIMEIRRHLVLMQNAFPEQMQTAYRGMERVSNPWNIPPELRMDWAEGLNVPTIQERPSPEILWWVGCAPSTDPRAQKTARAFARVLQAASVDYAVLGVEERCTGDSARRSGNEYLFYELATSNIDLLKRVNPSRIVTTCPHCLHTIRNEYPAFGGEFEVLHHTQFLKELFNQGRLKSKVDGNPTAITFHDPCYLGRHNGILEDPRHCIQMTGNSLQEMDRIRNRSFCCGAGGAHMWKEEEQGEGRVSLNRLAEAEGTGLKELAVSCPFCMIMLTDAIKTSGSDMRIRDIVEIVADDVLEDSDQ